VRKLQTPAGRIVRRCVLAATALLCLTLPATAVQIGDYAPDFNLVDLNGQAHALSDESGKIVLLCFLGYNADVCASSIRQVQTSLADWYSDRGLSVIGVDCWNGTGEQVSQFAGDNGIAFPLLLGGRDCASNYGLPYHSFVLIDGGGVVREIWQGPDASAFDLSAIQARIDVLLAEANAVDDKTWGRIKSLYGRKYRLT
jgi:peroxiredoxin